MERGFLEACLDQGMSLEAIGELAGKHPSTVSYWLKEHGLKARGAARHAPNGTVDKERLRELAEGGASIRSIGKELQIGYSTVRYWLARLGLETDPSSRRREGVEARDDGLRKACLKRPKHGDTEFQARSDGGFRCTKCRSSAVSNRRRQVKRQLIDEAGGKCRICGFWGHPAALQFQGSACCFVQTATLRLRPASRRCR